MPEQIDGLALAIAIFAPALATLTTATLMVAGRAREENVVAISRLAFLASFAATVAIATVVVRDGARELTTGVWFEAGHHAFHVRFLLDPLSAMMSVLTAGACSLIGHFSVTYLHGERGHARFYLLLDLFTVGMLLIVTAGSIDLLFVGWEIVGITSALLIGFFHERPTPVRNGLRAFATYRCCDVALLVGIIMLHHYAHETGMHVEPGRWAAGLPAVTGTGATVVGLALMLGAMGKSAQAPVGGWLPRAMEGPTPSSAIFYGALSIHAGVYLLIRAQPVFERSPVASGALIAVGAVTAITATLTGRVQSDVKTTLAYATMTQVGLMFIELGLHLPTVAALHLLGNAVLRCWQLLRAPAILHELHEVHGALEHELETGRLLDRIERKLPGRIGAWLYLRALDRFYFESLAERFLVRPFFALARALARLDEGVDTEQTAVAVPPQAATDGGDR